jgi:NTE family protein
MNNQIIIIFQILCMLFLSSVAAFSQTERPKIGLVLSGGGARGAAHVGVLKILEENHIPIDMIAGTSFGAIVGGLYASGYSADELEKILENIDWQETLSNSAPRRQRSFRRKKDDDGFLIKFKIGYEDGDLKLPSGLITPNNLRLTLGDLVNNKTEVNDFDKLAIPFRAVATDLETGNEVILKDGKLASAMVASMTVPALFPPVELDGMLLVDGGVANNIPINVARNMGADIVIVVDISTPLLKKDDITSFASVIDQLTMLQSNKAASEQLASLTDQDILIRPDLENIGFIDFENAIDAVPKGIDAAKLVIDRLQNIRLANNDWDIHLAGRMPEAQQQPTIDFIRIDNDSDLSDDVIRSRLSLKEGQKLNAVELSADLTEIYGMELFEEVDYNTVSENGQTGIEIHTKQREDGEDYLRFGLAIQEDFEGESGFQLAAGFTNLAINEYGGEWQALFKVGQEFSLFSELYQPIDFKENFYVYTNAGGGKINRNILSDDTSGTILGQARISQFSFQVGGGRNLGNWGTIRIGLKRSFGDIKGRIGFADTSKISFDETNLTAELLIDTLDNTKFPTKGIVFEIIHENSLSFLGGDGNVDTIILASYKPFSWGKNTLGLRSLLATSFNGNPNETNLFPLGGFMNLTAFAPGQITGNHGGLLTAIYYRRISGGPQYLTEMPIYIGGTVESGNAWNNKDDVSLSSLKWSSSVFVGIDTIIGPTYLGIGLGSDGATAAFLNIGQIF